MPDPTDWQARAVAAEVALEKVAAWKKERDAAISEWLASPVLSSLAVEHRNQIRGQRDCLEIFDSEVGHLPDLIAARELIRKAGEADDANRRAAEATAQVITMAFEVEEVKAENAALAHALGVMREKAELLDWIIKEAPSIAEEYAEDGTDTFIWRVNGYRGPTLLAALKAARGEKC